MALTAAQLDAFVASWRATQPCTSDTVTDLAAFVAAWRRETATTGHQLAGNLTPARLAQVVAALGAALAQARTSSFNVWRMASLGRSELRNAFALAGLFDPRGDHGLGSLPLAGLFDLLLTRDPSCPRPDDLGSCSVRVEQRPLGSERDRVDLVVDHPALLLFVEIKVDAREGARQLERYRESAAATAAALRRPAWRLAFLTRRPSARPDAPLIPIGWHDLARAVRLRLAAAEIAPEVRTPVAQLLDHFSKL